jgi:hypothetical protein
MLILTMARAELLQLTVEVVLDRLSPTRNDNDPAVLGDLDPHVLHTRLSSGPNGSGDVGLPECGGARVIATTVKSAYRSLLRARHAPTVPGIDFLNQVRPSHRDAGAQVHKVGWRRV